MAPFTEAEISENWRVWNLFQNGGIVLFRRQSTLDEAAELLRKSGYEVRIAADVECDDKATILKSIADALEVPEAGTNLDSFNDLISFVRFGAAKGVVLVLTGYDHFRDANPECAFHILDILADHHRRHLLLGNRFLCLVQGDDPSIDQHIGTVGGYHPIWNEREWQNHDRGL